MALNDLTRETLLQIAKQKKIELKVNSKTPKKEIIAQLEAHAKQNEPKEGDSFPGEY